MRKDVPPADDSQAMVPPCSATIFLLMARPRPVPSFSPLVVKKGSKICGRFSLGMPPALSRYSMMPNPSRPLMSRMATRLGPVHGKAHVPDDGAVLLDGGDGEMHEDFRTVLGHIGQVAPPDPPGGNGLPHFPVHRVRGMRGADDALGSPQDFGIRREFVQVQVRLVHAHQGARRVGQVHGAIRLGEGFHQEGIGLVDRRGRLRNGNAAHKENVPGRDLPRPPRNSAILSDPQPAFPRKKYPLCRNWSVHPDS